MNYSKTPFFNEYMPFFESVYEREWDLLVDINMCFIDQLIKWLGITTHIVKSSDYNVEGESTERIINLCKECGATTYLAGADGKNYMDMDQFEQNNIQLEIQDYYHPVYTQHWTDRKNENFISHMSVIDLLFNCGSESLRIMRG